jgi:hypothetical protein
VWSADPSAGRSGSAPRARVSAWSTRVPPPSVVSTSTPPAITIIGHSEVVGQLATRGQRLGAGPRGDGEIGAVVVTHHIDVLEAVGVAGPVVGTGGREGDHGAVGGRGCRRQEDLPVPGPAAVGVAGQERCGAGDEIAQVEIGFGVSIRRSEVGGPARKGDLVVTSELGRAPTRSYRCLCHRC